LVAAVFPPPAQTPEQSASAVLPTAAQLYMQPLRATQAYPCPARLPKTAMLHRLNSMATRKALESQLLIIHHDQGKP